MASPSPFQAAAAISQNLGGLVEEKRQGSTIDDILKRAATSPNPQDLNQFYGEVLSKVSPDRQQNVLAILQNKANEFKEQGQREKTAQYFESQGLSRELANQPKEIQLQALKERAEYPQNIEKAKKESEESRILAKHSRGEPITPEERASLSPTSLRSMIQAEKSTFEPTEEKLEAERVSKLATDIENDYQSIQSENMRLGRMEALDEKGELSTPLMITTLNKLGLPVGVLGNPDSEEFVKLEADYLRDVRNVFPGGRITNYEIQSYLKGIPSLLNTPEGRKAIIRNRRLINEAKQVRYDEYKKIIEENNVKKPRNLALLLNERTAERMADIEDRFIDSISKEVEKTQTPIKMIGPQGQIFNIPPNKIENAINDGFKFQ